MNAGQARKPVHSIILLLIIILTVAALACTAAGSAANNAPEDEETADTEPDIPADDETAEEEEAEPTEDPVEEEEVPPTEEPPEDPAECPFSSTFISDVTIPDGTELAPGTVFDKTWRIQNSGCQNWTEGTILVFDHGERMGAPDFISIPNTLTGNTTDLTVSLTAPADPGTFTGYWQCESPEGVRFCQVYVEIVVPEPTPEPTAEPTPEPTLERVVGVQLMETYPLTGNVSTGGCSGYLRAGIAPAGNGIRGAVTFDISDYAELDIDDAILSLGDFDLTGDPFEFLHPLNVDVIVFDSACDTLEVYGDEHYAQISTAAELEADIDVTDLVMELLSDDPAAQYVQFKLYFEGDDAGAGYDSMVDWNSAMLLIHYYR